MKTMRFAIPAVLLAVATAGCILVSGQFLLDFSLDDFAGSTESTVTKADIDLTTESDYQDHKDDLKSIADIAILGKITNNGATPIGAEVWITPGPTPAYTTADDVRANATKLWGSLTVQPGPANAVTVDWNESAKLFSTAGKTMLLDEAKGDGQFTLYAIGNDTTYNITVENGVLAIVLDFGK